MTNSVKKESLTGDELAARINQKLDTMPSTSLKMGNLGAKDLARIQAAAGLNNENCRQALFRTYLVLRRKNKKNRAEELVWRLLIGKNIHNYLQQQA
jgi:hypothetical protein